MQTLKSLIPDGVLNTITEKITNKNSLEVEAGTDGYAEGKDGAVTYIRLENLGGTQWDIELGKDGDGNNQCLELRLQGGAELQSIIAALDFISSTLKNQYGLKGNG